MRPKRASPSETMRSDVAGLAMSPAMFRTFSSDDGFYQTLQGAAARSGESFWRLPIDEEYAAGIRSSLVADLNETGGAAGASVGAKFIQHFTAGRPWIHLDIAGTSWPATQPPHMSPGPTGVTVRTLAELAVSMSASR